MNATTLASDTPGAGPGGLTRETVLRRALAGLVGLGAVGALESGAAALAGSARADGVTLSTLAWTPYVDPKVSKPFLAQHGAKISNAPLSTNDEILTKLKAGGIGSVDIVTPNVSYAPELVAADVIQPIDVSKVPNLAQVLPPISRTTRSVAQIGGKLYTVPYLWGYDAMVYNATKLPTPPRSWLDVMKPEYKGKIILADGPNANFEIWPRVLGYDLRTLTKDQLAKTVTFLIKLKKTQARAIIPDPNDQIDLLRGGDAWIVASGSFAGLPVLAAGRGGDKVAVTTPKEGGATWIDSYAIAKNAPNSDLAHAYINYMLAPKAEVTVAVANLEAVVNRSAVSLLSAKSRALFPYGSSKVGTGKLPLFIFPQGGKYATQTDLNNAWEQVSAA
jgi:spermidine/putrescine transport system substrate-binding protein